jgi:hypothetical protein
VTVLTIVPEVPVTVTDDAPAVAVLLAVRESVLVDVAGFGVNVAVTPLGRALVVNVTPPVKPLCGVMVIALVPAAPPRVIASDVGDAESVNVPPPDEPELTVKVSEALAVSVPEVPTILRETVPTVAVLLAVSDNVLVDVAGFGVNVAVTPLGRPEADNVTLPLKPPCGVMVIVLVPAAPPCEIVTVVGDAESAKVPPVEAGFTVRLIVVVCVKAPDVPVIVTVTVPVVAVLVAVSVSVLVVVAGFGLKAAVTPDGNPDADNVTLPLKPSSGVIVTVLGPLPPCTIVTGDVADKLKSGVAEPAGQPFTRFAALIVPMPVAKSHPVVVP